MIKQIHVRYDRIHMSNQGPNYGLYMWALYAADAFKVPASEIRGRAQGAGEGRRKVV